MRKIIFSFLIVILGACSTPPKKPLTTVRSDYGYTQKYMNWLIEREMADAKVTGLSIALVDDQQVVWQQGFGYADKLAKIKADSDTVYHLGSIAKVFTATAAMQLAEQGKLDIDRPIKQYLPQFSIKSRFGDAGEITPRNIMTHHSGLPLNWVRGMSEHHPDSFTDVVTAVKDEYMACQPDYVFAYSNLGVTLLGVAIGQASGEGYARYMDNHLLLPLGMTHSEFAPRIPGKSYNKGEEIEAVPLRDLPSGGLNSSVSDIARFMQMLFADGNYNGRQIVKAESLNEMFKVQNANVPMDFDFKIGLGWMLSGLDVPLAGKVLSHGGTTLNFHTLMATLPEHKLGVVVLSNSVTAQGVVSKIAAETLKLALEAKHGVIQQEKIIKKSREFPLSQGDIRAYDGYFDTLIGLVKVSGKTGRLVADIMGHQLELVPREDKQFGARFKLLGFIPIKIGELEELDLSLHKIDGHDVLALKSNEQSRLIGEKLVPVTIPTRFLDYVGEYEIINKHNGPLPETIRILFEDGLLIGAFTFSQKPGFVFRVAFMPVSEDELVMAGLGSGKGETLRLKRLGDEFVISYSGFELRKKPDVHG